VQKINKVTVFLISTILISILVISCQTSPDLPDRDFRQDMRDFVIRIADTAHITNSSFIVIPQNGQELISLADEPDGPLAINYVAAIDYGY